MAKKRPKTTVLTQTQPGAKYILSHLRERVVPLGAVRRDLKNCKKHQAADLDGIRASLREFGQVRAIVVDGLTGVIVAGNGTHEAAEGLGWEFIAVDVVQDMTPEQIRAYALADNRTAQLSQWDEEQLRIYCAEIENSSPQLYDALMLGDLAIAEGTPEECLPDAVTVPEKFACVVTIPTEAAQKKLFEFLRTHGYHDLRLITT